MANGMRTNMRSTGLLSRPGLVRTKLAAASVVLCSMLVVLLCSMLGCGQARSTFAAEPGGVSTSSGPGAPALLAVGSAESFVASVGINVHFNYYGSIYSKATPSMIARLQELGVMHLRDALCWQGPETWNTYYAVHQQLAALGFKTDYIASIDQPMNQIAAYPALVSDLEAIEPANEYDLSGDPAWPAKITAQTSQIRTTIDATAALADVTVVAPSLAYPGNAARLGSVGASADVGNLHGYFGGSNPGNAAVNPVMLMAQVQPDTPGKAIWVTETGYFAAPGAIFGMNGVTPAMQAIYSQRALMEYWNAGAARTYLYELADDVEPGQSPGDFHWGLLDSAGVPKPAFSALANLIRLLSDPGPAFQPAPLALRITPSASTVHSTLLGKRDGSYYLVLWNEVQSYDVTHNVELATAPQSVTLSFARAPRSSTTQQFDEAGGCATTTIAPAQTLMLSVTDRIQVVSLVF
jgi:hypothetical protein